MDTQEGIRKLVNVFNGEPVTPEQTIDMSSFRDTGQQDLDSIWTLGCYKRQVM